MQILMLDKAVSKMEKRKESVGASSSSFTSLAVPSLHVARVLYFNLKRGANALATLCQIEGAETEADFNLKREKSALATLCASDTRCIYRYFNLKREKQVLATCCCKSIC